MQYSKADYRIIVQAQLGSVRFPGKIKHTLNIILHECTLSGFDTVLTIPYGELEDVEAFLTQPVRIICGPLKDLIGSFILAANPLNMKHIIRITGDCLCITHEMIDTVARHHCQTGADYTTNTYNDGDYVSKTNTPEGVSVEIFTVEMLKQANAATDKHDREHITPWIRRHTNKIEICNTPLMISRLAKLSVDTPEDLEVSKLIRQLIDSKIITIGA